MMIELWDAAVNDYKWIQTSEIQQSPPRWEEKTESTGCTEVDTKRG